MSDYLMEHGQRQTPQSEQADQRQKLNEAGGYVFEIGDWAQLRRWLILGSESGDYYAGTHTRTVENVGVLDRCLQADPRKAIEAIVDVSDGGLAISNEQALFALARAMNHPDKDIRVLAGRSLPLVARTGTHLFHFVKYAEGQRGWGPILRKAVAGWYESKTADDLAYQAVKYRQRDGVSQRDLLRLAHPKAINDPSKGEVYGFISGNWLHEQGTDEQGRVTRPASPWERDSNTPKIIEGFILAQESDSAARTAQLILDYRLPREAVKPEHLNSPEVWRALLDVGMPIMAMTRNLATMTRNGILTGDYLGLVYSTLQNPDAIRKSRLHPMALLIALRTYASGHGVRGGHSWTPIPGVTDALDEAFYLAFDNVEPTNIRTLLALDVSGSMQHYAMSGIPMSPAEASVAMALITLHAEPDVEVIGFTQRLFALPLSRRQRLDDAMRHVQRVGESTDVSLPWQYAAQASDGFGAVIAYTDNETWAGMTHTHQAVRRWRDQGAGPNGAAISVGMTSNGWTVLDPSDPRSMNVTGFDASAPALMSAFVSGKL